MVLSDFYVAYNIILIVVAVICFAFGVNVYRKKGISKKMGFFSLVFVLVVCFADNLFITSKTVTLDDYYEIVEQKQIDDFEISKVRLPHDKYVWIKIRGESVSDDGKKVELTVVQNYNWCGLMVDQYVSGTWLYNGQ